MAIFQVPNINISGISACVPEDEYNNNSVVEVSNTKKAIITKKINCYYG